MNYEQLKRINELVSTYGNLIELLSEAKAHGDIFIQPRYKKNVNIFISTKIMEPILIAECEKVKAELKELGYEVVE